MSDLKHYYNIVEITAKSKTTTTTTTEFLLREFIEINMYIN